MFLASWGQCRCQKDVINQSLQKRGYMKYVQLGGKSGKERRNALQCPKDTHRNES